MKKAHKETVRTGYNIIADRYLATRTRDSEDVHLLDELITPSQKLSVLMGINAWS